ncbi:hypothetical protein NPIL_78401 [Nephila pilipes]|uniref:Uncharacterized protein n=1 Tax=Nephila pilipes TaxID=299642 RepID=A0A8X6Q2T8_NEPPI|nr:hypothetical protein NPIL_78401 [Nephila pilipes]
MLVKEVQISINLDKELYDPCFYGKAHWLSFGTWKKASESGELISADVCGPINGAFSEENVSSCIHNQFYQVSLQLHIKEKSEVKNILEHRLR